MPEEKEIQTSAGMETATQTVNRIKQTLDSGVAPVDALESNVPNFDIPQIDPSTFSPSSTLRAAEALTAQNRLSKEEQKELEQTGSLRELSLLMSGRGLEEREMLESRGVNEAQQQLDDLMARISQGAISLSEFDDETFLGEESMRGDAAGRDITKNIFSAAARERRLQRAIDRTDKAARLRTKIAAAETLRGNIDSARADIREGLDIKYSFYEQQFELEKQFLNRQYQKVDSAKREAIDTRRALIAREEKNIDDAKQLVDAAVASGAEPLDIESLMEIKDPYTQANAARGVIGRMAYRQRLRGESLENLQIANQRAMLDMKEFELAEAKDIAAARKLALEGGAIPLTEEQRDTAFKVIDDYEAALKGESISDLVSSYAKINQAASNPSAAGDLALIFNYMKMLDPGSVVREGEFANAQNAGGITTKVRAQYNNILNGQRLTPEQRADFVDQSRKIYGTAVDAKKRIDNTFIDRSARFGVPSDVVIRDISVAENGEIEPNIISDENAEDILNQLTQ